jgi:hypothetical protein
MKTFTSHFHNLKEKNIVHKSLFLLLKQFFLRNRNGEYSEIELERYYIRNVNAKEHTVISDMSKLKFSKLIIKKSVYSLSISVPRRSAR